MASLAVPITLTGAEITEPSSGKMSSTSGGFVSLGSTTVSVPDAVETKPAASVANATNAKFPTELNRTAARPEASSGTATPPTVRASDATPTLSVAVTTNVTVVPTVTGLSLTNKLIRGAIVSATTAKSNVCVTNEPRGSSAVTATRWIPIFGMLVAQVIRPTLSIAMPAGARSSV